MRMQLKTKGIECIFLLLIAFSLLGGCGFKPTNRRVHLKLRYDSIPVNVDQLNFYYTYIFYKDSDSLFLCAFNHIDYSIDIFNLTSKDSRKIKLDREGPKGIPGIGNLAHAEGKIYTYYQPNRYYSISLENNNAQLEYEIDASKLNEYQTGKPINYTQYQTLAFSPDERYFARNIYHPDLLSLSVDHIYSDRYFNALITDIKTKESKPIHIPYPDVNSKTNTTFGELDVLTYTFINNHILLVGFQNSPDMRIFNLETDEIKKIDLGELNLPTAESLSFYEHKNTSLRLRHQANETNYYQVNYHPDKKIIYRCYKGKTETNSVFDYSENKLVLFDEKLNMISNEKLDESIYPMLFPVATGLIGLIKDNPDEDYLKVCYFDFEDIKTQ